MLTDAAARWITFVAFFLRALGFSEVWADNQLNTDCWFGEVGGMVPKQQ